MSEILRRLVNRNPRNLEKLRIARKPVGFHFEKNRQARSYYYTLEFDRSSHHTSGFVRHISDGRIISASTKEPAISSRLHSNTDVSAAYNIGRVLARRCLQAGVHFINFDELPDESRRSERMQAFRKAFEEGGVVLKELPFIEPSYDIDPCYHAELPAPDYSKDFEPPPPPPNVKN